MKEANIITEDEEVGLRSLKLQKELVPVSTEEITRIHSSTVNQFEMRAMKGYAGNWQQ